MRIAIISPTQYLEEFSGYNNNRYHLALAHRVLTDKVYSTFYRKMSDRGDFVILDNGACELGESLKKEELVKAISIINPSQLVLPDKLNDPKATIKLTNEFLNYFKDQHNLSFMAVVQGQTKQDWLNCFNEFNNNIQIQTIGISNTNAVFPNNENEFSRVETIKYLFKQNLINRSKNIHLLGLNSSGHIELDLLKDFNFIEGTDSSAPIVHGALGIEIIENVKYQKIRKYLADDILLNAEQKQLINKNLELFFKVIK